MKVASVLKRMLYVFFFIAIPSSLLAGDGKTWCNTDRAAIILNPIDTIPAARKSQEDTRDKVDEEAIKLVPKAHKQPLPVPVANIKPVKIIKPNIKFNKPVIKLLH